VNTVSYMSANYVAREVGYAMHGWGHGDQAEAHVERAAEIALAVGAISVEHEPEHEDPSADCRAMREQLEEWLR
jgi:hypothetical protein